MSRATLFFAVLLGLALSITTSRADEPIIVKLWPGEAPDEVEGIGEEYVRMSPSLDRSQVEVTESTRLVSNVTVPTIAIYRPAKEKANGTTMLICPGGGYWNLYYELEGEEVAKWANDHGMTGVILKYRVPRRPDDTKGEPARRPLQDAQRAVSILRSRAEEWGIEPNKIGMIGFSAGGHLSVATATYFDQRTYKPLDDIDTVSCRPDFAVAAYSGYLKKQDKDELSSHIRIPEKTPPVFLVHGTLDPISAPENSVLMYLALQKVKIPAELHIYAATTHDFGVRSGDRSHAAWTDACVKWLKELELMKPRE
jgi:acetyl esterase/lipase